MMKTKALSLLLLVSMLLSVFTLYASPTLAASGRGTSTASNESVSYLDLYVKDGLLALFDAYGNEASDTKLTKWDPVDLYGKAGYDAYIDPTTYSAPLMAQGARFKWVSVDGGVRPQLVNTSIGDWSNYAYLDLNSLGAKLGTIYTVQEVYTHTKDAPVIENGVLKNYTTIKPNIGRVSAAWIGAYNFGGCQQTGAKLDGTNNLAMVAVEQMQFGSAYIGHFTWLADATKYDALKGDDGANLNGYYVGVSSITIERTVGRLGVTSSVGADGTTQYTSTMKVGYNRVPSKRTGHAASVGSFAVTSAAEADHMSTKLWIAADHATTHSIRIYNKDLSNEEIEQNHMADLVAFYGADAAAILAMDEGARATLATSLTAVQPTSISEDAFNAGKKQLEDAIKNASDAFNSANEAGKKVTDYDKLYVGFDRPSENGAKLLALYTAYGAGSPSVDLKSGIWADKIAGNHAKIIGGAYSTANTVGWKLRADGGFGYNLTIEYKSGNWCEKHQVNNNSVIFDPALISSPDFTVEYVAAFLNYQQIENGVVIGDYTGQNESHWSEGPIPTDTIGILKNYAARAGALSGVYRAVRWCVVPPAYDYNTGGVKFGYNSQMWSDARPTTAIFNQTVTRDESSIGSGEYEAVYSVYADGAKKASGTYSTAEDASVSKAPVYYKDIEGQELKLFHQVPISVYAVRVYDAALSLAEMKYNRFVDLAAYCGADLTNFLKLDKTAQQIVIDMMAVNPYSTDKAAFDEAVASFSNLAGSDSEGGKLYVKDGLSILLAAYSGYSTESVASGENSVIWANAVKAGTFGILRGTGWTKNANGGFTIVKTLDDYSGTRPGEIPAGGYGWYQPLEEYGLYLDGLVPEESYTVELVANPVGITNEDGTRWIDSYSRYGTYIENGFAVGPLRALQFGCYRVGNDGQMERRWVYGKGSAPSGGNALVKDIFWQGIDIDDIVTLTISMQVTPNTHNYTISQSGKGNIALSVNSSDVLRPEEADNMFRLMCGVAGTIYSVRVYDRVLTEAERAQNRMADLVYFYGIDAGIVEDVAASAGGALGSLTEAFADFDFEMEKTEAQEIFAERITAVWLSNAGFGIRKDKTDGMRYYFDINQKAIDAVMKAGFSVEVGAVANVGKSASPVLEGYGYDYRIVAFDSTMGKEKGHFIDEDTFVMTVRYLGGDRNTLVTSVDVRGYLKIIDADGNETLYYTFKTDKTPSSMFEAYYLINEMDHPTVLADLSFAEYVTARIDRSFKNEYIYVNASAAGDGNGTKDAPFLSFETAFLRAKELLRATNTPTNLYIELADGKYPIYSTLELLGSDKPYNYASFTVTSQSGNAVLTTEKAIDASGFTLEGDCIYSYQLEADENGKYPAFRCLYVNDTLATIATSGSDRAAKRENLYLTSFDRTFNGIYQTAKDTRNIADFTFIPENYAGREDLEEEFIYYRDRFLALADLEKAAKTNPASLSGKMSPIRAGGSAAYNEAFATFLPQIIASAEAYELAKVWKHDLTLAAYKNSTATKTASDFASSTAYEAYKAAYVTARNASVSAKTPVLYTDYTVAQRDDVRHIGKLYMPENMVGDLRDKVAAGKTAMIAYVASELTANGEELARKNEELALLRADLDKLITDGADESSIAALRAELDALSTYIQALESRKKSLTTLSASVNDENLWVRHALTLDKIELHHTCQWNYNIVHLSGVDYNDYVEVSTANGIERHVAIYMLMDEYNYFQINSGYSTADRYVHMKNAYEYLDENGEYFYDEKTGKIYLYSTENVKDYEIGYATTDNMFIIRDAKKVTFDNVQFTGTDDYELTENGYTAGLSGMQSRYAGIWGAHQGNLKNQFQDRAALYFMNCAEITVKNCRFYDLPCEALDATGWNENYLIKGNTFENIGSSAIRIGTHRSIWADGSGGSWFENKVGARNVTVTENYLHNIATEYYVPALMITKLDQGEIQYNTVTDCSYTALSLGWDWDIKPATYDAVNRVNIRNVDISYNYITNFMTEMGDGGAIYMPIQNGPVSNTDFYINAVHHNYILFSKITGDGTGKMVVGIYFDASTSNWHCHENVVVEQSYGAHASETDLNAFGVTEEEAELKRLRRQGSDFIYLQHIDAQECYNILVENNYILNVRATTEKKQFSEVYQNFFEVKDAVEGRNLHESGTVYVVGLRGIPYEAEEIIEASGATGHNGDINDLYDNNY